MRSVAGYVTNNNRKRDRKEAQKGADKNLKEENLRACLNFAQSYFEGCFRGYFSVVMRSIAGYVTRDNRKIDRKEAQRGLNKKLSEENLNRL